MKSDSIHMNNKVCNIGLINRYKMRQMKSFNLNLKPIPCLDKRDFAIYDNYSPFTVNSKNLLEFPQQIIVYQVKQLHLDTRKVSTGRQLTAKNKNKSLARISNLARTTINKTQQHAVENKTVYDRSNSRRKALSQRSQYSQTKTKRCTCGKCQECMKDFAYFLQLCSDDRSVPQISAKSWCIWRQKDDKFYYYYGKRIHKVREIASLTKMITAMVMMDYAHKYGFQLGKTKFAAKKSSALVGGTTAKLNVDEVYTLKELLYGMMLPSGNDAAIAISEAISLMINLKQKQSNFDPHSDDWFEEYQNKSYAYLFINAMNEKVQRLGTIDTKLYNSHGNDAFDQLKNISTCNQIAKVSTEFMRYPLLREVAKTPEFTFSNGTRVENTNKLLEDGFEGIKTGITQTAGPCLAACYKDLVIVVLNSKSMDSRWIEVKKLVKWIRSRH